MWVKFRHKLFHFLFRLPIYIGIRIKYRFKTKKYKLPKGSHLILFNHPSNLDPLYTGLTFTRPTYFIANEDLFSLGFTSKVLNHLVAPIPKQKSMRDTSTIRTSLKVVKEGGNIGVAPEGNRTYSGDLNYIDPSIVKFAKLLKVPVVLFTIKGGFGKNPRFAKDIRKGKVLGEVSRYMTKEEVMEMTSEELYEAIVEGLRVDDTKLGLKYKSKTSAEFLESVFYVCHVCGEFHTMRSEKDIISCLSCNTKARYTENLVFEPLDDRFKFKTVNEYYKFQDNLILNYDILSLKYNDSEVTVYEAKKSKKRKPIITGELSLDKEGLKLVGENETWGESISDIVSLAVLYHNTIIVNFREIKYHLVGSDRFNALKYVHLFTRLKNKELGEENELLGI